MKLKFLISKVINKKILNPCLTCTTLCQANTQTVIEKWMRNKRVNYYFIPWNIISNFLSHLFPSFFSVITLNFWTNFQSDSQPMSTQQRGHFTENPKKSSKITKHKRLIILNVLNVTEMQTNRYQRLREVMKVSQSKFRLVRSSLLISCGIFVGAWLQDMEISVSILECT